MPYRAHVFLVEVTKAVKLSLWQPMHFLALLCFKGSIDFVVFRLRRELAPVSFAMRLDDGASLLVIFASRQWCQLTSVMSSHNGAIGIWHRFSWKKNLRSSKVAWRVHLLQDARHALLSLFLFSHLGKLTSRNGRLLVPLLELFVRQEVLSHDARDLFKII